MSSGPSLSLAPLASTAPLILAQVLGATLLARLFLDSVTFMVKMRPSGLSLTPVRMLRNSSAPMSRRPSPRRNQTTSQSWISSVATCLSYSEAPRPGQSTRVQSIFLSAGAFT